MDIKNKQLHSVTVHFKEDKHMTNSNTQHTPEAGEIAMQRFIIYQSLGDHYPPDEGKWFCYDLQGPPDNDVGPFDSLDECLRARDAILRMEQ